MREKRATGLNEPVGMSEYDEDQNGFWLRL